MERWVGKVAVVTGAASGIGAAITQDLLQARLIVVGLDQNADGIERLRLQLPDGIDRSALHARHCDLTDEQQIIDAFAWIDKQLGGVDILVNNAGVFEEGRLLDSGNTRALRRTLDVNLLAPVLCAREAFQSMQRLGKAGGHVVNISSVCGLVVPRVAGIESFNMYTASKHGITAVTEVLRQEFDSLQTKVKITSICPGTVGTPLITDAMRESMVHLQPTDVSACVLFAIGTPPDVQIHQLVVKPMGEQC